MEFLQFCTVGLGSYIVDVGLFNFLAYSGAVNLRGTPRWSLRPCPYSRRLSFPGWSTGCGRSKTSQIEPLEAGFLLFLAINIGGLLIALGCAGISASSSVSTLSWQLTIAASGVGLVLARHSVTSAIVTLFSPKRRDALHSPEAAS